MRKTNENNRQSQSKNCGRSSNKDCSNKESGTKNCGKNTKNCK